MTRFFQCSVIAAVAMTAAPVAVSAAAWHHDDSAAGWVTSDWDSPVRRAHVSYVDDGFRAPLKSPKASRSANLPARAMVGAAGGHDLAIGNNAMSLANGPFGLAAANAGWTRGPHGPVNSASAPAPGMGDVGSGESTGGTGKATGKTSPVADLGSRPDGKVSPVDAKTPPGQTEPKSPIVATPAKPEGGLPDWYKEPVIPGDAGQPGEEAPLAVVPTPGAALLLIGGLAPLLLMRRRRRG